MKFAMVLCLALFAGCKTDGAESTETPASTTEQTVEQNKKSGRSGKIDLPPRLPGKDGVAADDDDDDDDGERRGRRDRGPMTDEEREKWRDRREERRQERMTALDTNKDGEVSTEERAAARAIRIDEMKTRLDENGDGKLTVDELGKGRMGRRMDPAEIDTDKNGEISNDELTKSMEDMRGRMRNWRGRRGEGGEGSGRGSAAPDSK